MFNSMYCFGPKVLEGPTLNGSNVQMFQGSNFKPVLVLVVADVQVEAIA